MRRIARKPKLHVAEISGGAKLFLGVVRLLGCRSPELIFIDVQFSTPDQSDQNLTVSIELEMIKLADMLVKTDGADTDWLPGWHKFHYEQWNKLLKSQIIYSNFDMIGFILFNVNYYNNIVIKNKIDIYCYVSLPSLGSGIVNYYNTSRFSQTNFNVRQWISIATVLRQFNIMPGGVSSLIKNLFAVKRSNSNEPYVSIDPAAVGKGIILQQYTPDSMPRYPAAGQFYWFDQSGIDPKRVVVYFNRPDNINRAEVIKEIKKLGFGYIIADNPSVYLDHAIMTLMKCLWWSIRSFPFSAKRFEFWRWKIYSRYNFNAEAYRQLLAKYNVLTVKQSWVYLQDTMALKIASDKNDTVFLWNFWSMHKFFQAIHFVAEADIIFSWGPFHEGYVKLQNFDYRLMFQVGLVQGDGVDISDDLDAGRIKALLGKSVDFVLCAFDTSFGSGVHNRADHIADFYDCLVALLIKHPTWGCIVKPKAALDGVPLCEQSKCAISKLKGQKRWIDLQWEVRPSVVIRAGDLTVCASPNTAGFVAATLGKSAVHLDLGNLGYHPFLLTGVKQNILYNSVREFSSAIEAYAEGDLAIGDYENFLSLIDSFKDSRGRFRVGELLQGYLAARDAGQSKSDALAKIADQYADKYGPELVFRDNKLEDTAGEKIWLAVRAKLVEAGYEIPAIRLLNHRQ